MKFVISSLILAKYPTLQIGLVVAKDITNSASDSTSSRVLRLEENRARTKSRKAKLEAHQRIALWRDAYSSFGVDPSRCHPAAESLLRQVLKTGRLSRINKLVDLANAVSLRSMLPIAVWDLDRVEGDMVIRFARGDEHFREIGSSQTLSPDPGEVIYADGREALSRRWNWRASDKTKILLTTSDALLTVEGIGNMGREYLEHTTRELAALIQDMCGGKVLWYFLDKDNPLAEY
ncbi:hypothetical protein ANRL4_02412 [Anaerolineae bacterium]|nr:hypothetical protein ANRL4_02412 [Anaerolineae bacterium]